MTNPTSPETAHDVARETGEHGSRGLVVVLSRDLFFGMRIRTSLRQLGYDVKISPDVAAFADNLESGGLRASIGLIDFNNAVDWDDLADVLKSGIPMIAFGPHKDIEGFRSAKRAGVTRVVANGEFSRSLPKLVEKYAT